GGFALTDPVSSFIPSFADVRVYAGGSDLRQGTMPAPEPGRVWTPLTPTPGGDLAQACDLWAGLPLLFQPGTEWNYSMATDVLGRVIEVVSGQRLDEFLAARILRPLGMTDTGFFAGETQLPRLAALYTPGAGGT